MTTQTSPEAGQTITQLKCACGPCLCVVDLATAIEQNGQYYCSAACAGGHTGETKGCGHPGCNCCG